MFGKADLVIAIAGSILGFGVVSTLSVGIRRLSQTPKTTQKPLEITLAKSLNPFLVKLCPIRLEILLLLVICYLLLVI